MAVGRLERSVLAAFLHQPGLAERYLAGLDPADLSTAEQRSVLSAIADLLKQGEPVTPQAVLSQVPPEARSLVAELAVSQTPPERLEEEMQRAIRLLAERRLRRDEEVLRKSLETAGSAEEEQELLKRLSECKRRRSALAGERIVGEA